MASSSMGMSVVVDDVRCYWVDTLAQAEYAVSQLRLFDVVAVDLEGKNLGHGGRAATIQLYGGDGSDTEVCYVIDLKAFPEFPNSVRWLLESGRNTTPPGPLKVCHAFDGDQINLIEQFSLDFSSADLFDTQEALKHLRGETQRKDAIEQLSLDFSSVDLFDTQEALKHLPGEQRKDVVRSGHQSKEAWKAARTGPYANTGMGLLDILTTFSNDFSAEAGANMEAMKKQLRFVNFFQRPLPDDILRYMCRDVLYLVGAYRKMKELLLAMEGGQVKNTHEQDNDGITIDTIVGVMSDSRYCGPYAKGVCYRPPTTKQRERQFLKGKVWCEEKREWIVQ